MNNFSWDNDPYKQKYEINPNPGTSNQNPKGISLFSLIKEDFHTHDNNIISPGFIALFVHRFGNKRMDIKSRIIRLPFSVLYAFLYALIKLIFGIDLDYSVRVGRRLRIWHHGGIFIGAISIGDDVTLRHNVTVGIAHQTRKWDKPIIEDRVDIGSGAAILGPIIVRHDTVIGANSVVVRNFPAESVLFGVPARPVKVISNP
jgi:serine O-acetyltransferase